MKNIYRDSCRNIGLLIIVVMSIVIYGCGENRLSDVEYINKAEEYQSEGDVSSAVIELKNALQVNPENTEARVMLGTLYLDVGSGEAAEKEFRRAVDLGVTDKGVNILLGRALLLQRQFDKVIEEVDIAKGSLNKENADALALRAEAYMGLGDMDLARQSYEELIEVKPDSIKARLGMARMALMNNDISGAEELLEQAFEIDGQSKEAWLFKGDLAFTRNNYDVSENAFQWVIDNHKGNTLSVITSAARMGLIRARLAQNNNDGALQSINELEELKSRHPILKYFRALIAYRKHEYEKAQEYLHEVDKQWSDFLPNVLLMGSTYFAQGLYGQAEQYLSRYVKADPKHVPARKLLAEVRIRLDQPDKALEMLMPLVGTEEEDAELLSIVGNASLLAGDYQTGTTYLRKAVESSPETAVVREQLAYAYLQGGEADRAIKEIESVIAHDDTQFRSSAMLVIAHIQKEDVDKALEAAVQLQEKFPNDPRSYWMMAGVYQVADDSEEKVVEQLDKALALDATFVPALLGKAGIEIKNGDLQQAQKDFEAVLANNSKNVQAMVGLAQVSEMQGDIEAAVDWLEKGRVASPESLVPRLLLAKYYLARNDIQMSLDLTEELLVHHPENPDVLNMRGTTLMASGDINRGVVTFKKLSEVVPEIPVVHFRLGRALMQAGDEIQARAALEKVLALDGNFLPAKSLLVALDARSGQFEQASARIADIKKTDPSSPAGDALEGDLAMFQKRYADAAKAYQKAVEKTPQSELLLKQHNALKLSGNIEQAKSVLKTWLDTHPDDVNIRLVLASTYHSTGNNDDAIKHYREVLTRKPDDYMALNDLAWLIYNKNKDPEALALAERAHNALPERVEAMDTYGWILVQEGQVEKGLPLLKNASEKSSGIPDIAYHYAVALEKSGKKKEAKQLLEKILTGDKEFQDKENAKQLLEKL